MHARNPRVPQLLPVALLATVAVAALVTPFPGASLSVVVTRAAAGAGFAIPGVELLSDGMLLLLALGTVVALVRAWMRTPQRRTLVAATSVGVILAYAASEAGKLIFEQARPCTLWATAGTCDAADFSLPSNHATLAFGAAFVIAIATRRLSWTIAALSAAVVVAVGRLLEGVHYLHDVAAGTLLGLTVPAILASAVAIVARRRSRGAAAGEARNREASAR